MSNESFINGILGVVGSSAASVIDSIGGNGGAVVELDRGNDAVVTDGAFADGFSIRERDVAIENGDGDGDGSDQVVGGDVAQFDGSVDMQEDDSVAAVVVAADGADANVRFVF